MVVLVNTFGLIPQEDLIIAQPLSTAHVLLVGQILLPLWEIIITANQELLTLKIFLLITLSDPLWDGSGCITSNCCGNPTQPWFFRRLSEATTSDIEARLCNEGHGFIHRSVVIDQFELYIQ